MPIFVCAPSLRRRGLVAALIVASRVAVAAADDRTMTTQRRTTVDRPVLVRTHAHWDGNCQANTLPTIRWLAQPQHGRVDIEEGEVTAGGNWAGGTPCKGVKMRGLRLVYQPAAGFRGTDAFSYEVRYDAKLPTAKVEASVSVE